jgi:putative ABC transport system permease protein
LLTIYKNLISLLSSIYKSGAPWRVWSTGMETLVQDLRAALRGFRRRRGFAAAVVLTMGLGIGANAAIFSVVYGVVLRPLPYRNGDDLVILRQQRPRAGILNQGFSPLEMADYRHQSKSFEQIVEYHNMFFVLLGRGEPERVQTGVVSWNYFDLFGVAPVAGRTFREADEQMGADAVLMLSYNYWQSRFGGDQRVVGQVFEMNDRPHTVVGVLPPIPQFPDENDVYMPVSACPFRSSEQVRTSRNARMVQAFGRVHTGTSLESVRGDVALVASRLQQAYPENYPQSVGFTATALSLRDELTRTFRPTLAILLGAAGFLLLIVCASVANLMLARLLEREREMAIRMSLGAGRWRLVRQLLTESTLLAVMGATVGLGIAAATLDLLVTLATQFTSRSQEISLNGPVLLFTLGIAMITGVVVGALPALPGRVSLASAIQEGGRTVSAGRGSLRNALIVAQVAVSFVLLIGAGLMLRSLLRLQAVDPGVRTDSVMSMRVALNFTKYNTPALREQFLTQLDERIRNLPGVRSAGAAATFPLNEGGAFSNGVRVEGQPQVEAARLPRADFQAATPGYFQTVGIPLLRGRLIDDRDIADREPVAVISESMSRQFFTDGDAVGARISNDNGRSWIRIVGVVGDVRNALAAQPASTFYRPLAQAPLGTAMFLARTVGPPTGVTQPMRDSVYAIDPNQPVDRFRTLDDVRSAALAAPRLTAMLISVFAGIAMLITAAGLAGVIAFSVSQRSQEFGVRMALGASRGSVLALVLAQGLRLVLIGLLLGGIAAFGLARTVRVLLFNTEPTDVLTYLLVAALLALVAVLACFFPARRASSVDPLVSLRAN